MIMLLVNLIAWFCGFAGMIGLFKVLVESLVYRRFEVFNRYQLWGNSLLLAIWISLRSL